MEAGQNTAAKIRLKEPNINRLLGFILNTQKTFTLEKVDEKTELMKDIEAARGEWLHAAQGFDMAMESELVDYYVYVLKAAEIKYQHYLRKAKAAGYKIDDTIDLMRPAWNRQ